MDIFSKAVTPFAKVKVVLNAVAVKKDLLKIGEYLSFLRSYCLLVSLA